MSPPNDERRPGKGGAHVATNDTTTVTRRRLVVTRASEIVSRAPAAPLFDRDVFAWFGIADLGPVFVGLAE